VAVARKFLKEMSIPFESKMQEGISTWDMNDLRRHQAKMQEEEIRMLQAQMEEAAQEGGATSRRAVEDFEMDEDAEEAMMQLDA